MLRQKIQPWDVAPVVENIRYMDRKCSDGQCCAYNTNDPDLPGGPFEILFWILVYKKNLYAYVHRVLRVGCPDLDLRFEEDQGNLYIGTSCRIYPRRPPECRRFGAEIRCNFEEYVRRVQEDRFYRHLFVLVAEKEKYLRRFPYLERYDLASRYPGLRESLAAQYIQRALYIPMPADEAMLPHGSSGSKPRSPSSISTSSLPSKVRMRMNLSSPKL